MSDSLQAEQLIQQQREFFVTGQTKNVNFRLEQLKYLKQIIIDYQAEIIAAINADLNRPEFEAYFEIAAVSEVNHAIKHLKSWTKSKRVRTSLEQFPSSAQICPEPLGIILIIGPWNYPFQLMISPLVGAIAAGNCAILKPSEIAANTSKVVAKMIQEIFDPAYVAVVEGGVKTSQALLTQKFDHIFFTGGTKVGKIIMESATKYLTPVTLELGGKSPCIVETDTHLDYTAKRITWGKFINAGQTCVAPDYLLVNRKIKADLLKKIKENIQAFYGNNPEKSPDYCRIISERHFKRLSGFLQNGQIVIGGQTNLEEKYIAPTILDQVSWEDPVMQEEIFGPILPILDYNDLGEAIAQVNAHPKPLALYFFSKNKAKQQRVLQETSSGSVGLNDTVMQFSGSYLPFGGVGESGIGSYHGKASFDLFSHYKSVLKNSFWIDLNLRYAPYKGKIYLIKKILAGL
ncbi:MAG: aldehyde dehydrogenase [Cyanobacteriota bacterium]|nr:aldehyde dehydrogenase [Cyanobacteriota bacterium]